MQEEEREKRLDFVPDVPWMDSRVQDGIPVDSVTHRMLKRMETGVPRSVRVHAEEVRRPAQKSKRAPAPSPSSEAGSS